MDMKVSADMTQKEVVFVFETAAKGKTKEERKELYEKEFRSVLSEIHEKEFALARQGWLLGN